MDEMTLFCPWKILLQYLALNPQNVPLFFIIIEKNYEN